MPKFTRLWGASLLALAAPAAAQDTQAGTVPSAGAVEDIVVTASRRAESVQESSLAISVVGGEALADAGVTSAADLGTVVPGLTVSLGGGTNQTYLRGVGSFATDASAESAIAYNINGVYISRPNGIGPIFFDLERVEVLKGPQGTLYGRNATGGAINVITKRPTRQIDGELSIDIGNYDLLRVTGAIGGGVGDTLAVRAAAQYSKHDGYLTDGYNDQDSIASRLTALWEPSANVSLLVTGEYASIDSQGETTVKTSTLTAVPDDPWEGPSIGTIQQPPTAFIPGGTRITDDGFNEIDIWAVSAELNVDLGAATLTFIPAYRDTKAAYLTFTPGFYFQTHETSQQQSYELRLGNDGPALKWVAGAYYFDEDQTQLYELQAFPIQNSIVNTPMFTRSWAVFGEATYSLTDSLRAIGGIRYSEDKKRQEGFTNAFLPTVATIDNSGERTFDDVSWKGGLEFDVGPRNMLFATAAKGYKSGGFFPSVPAPNNSYDPEKLTAFTVGSRNRFADNRIQLNLEGFYWKYRDKQERFLGATPSGTTGLLTTNAGKATLYGANVDLVFRPTRNDTFHAGVEYLHSKYDSFIYSAYSPPIAPPFPGFVNSYPPEATGCTLGPVVPYTLNDNPPLPPGVPVPPALGTDATQQVDCSGMPLVRAPKWSGVVSYERAFDLGGGNRIVAGADAQFASSQFLSPDFIQSGRDDGYVSIDADISFEAAQGYAITLWGRNLTEEAIYTGGGRYAFSRGVSAGGDPTLFYANIRAPRTYGVTLKAGF